MLKISPSAIVAFKTKSSGKSRTPGSRNKEVQYVNVNGVKYKYEDKATQKSNKSIAKSIKKTSSRIAQMNLTDWLEYEQRYTNLVRRDLSIR
jgi:hypothetical protein